MTYFGVLWRFIGPPLVVLLALALWDDRRGRAMPPAFRTWPWWAILLGHVLIALVYTTPWDNYLVASGVWWYDPALVTGIRLGWVPIEEYTFFIVQTLMAGLWLAAWMRRLPVPTGRMSPRPTLRWGALAAAVLVWVWAVGVLLARWRPGWYMALILAWALPPIALQIGFGADILWRYRRLVALGLLPPFLYLCFVDGLAIASGTWTINPDQILGVTVAGVLPLEEATFFLVTTVLIVFGTVLLLARESHMRAGLGAKKWM